MESNDILGFEEISSPEFYDCFSSPKPLITPNKLFLGDCADDKAIDWTILENCNPNLDTPKTVPASSEKKKNRKSLIPSFSPPPPERQPSGILSASGNRGSKSRRVSSDITEVLVSRASSGRKSTIEKETSLLEIAELKEKIINLEAQAAEKDSNVLALQQKLSQQESLTTNLQEELTAIRFFAQIQGQKIEEQENLLMSSKMDYQEGLSAKNRKYKLMIKKLQAERTNYEKGASTIIQQLNDQMSQLQTFALTRIETLEKQLLESRRQNEVLTQEVLELKSVAHEHVQQLSALQSSAQNEALRGRSLSPMGRLFSAQKTHQSSGVTTNMTSSSDKNKLFSPLNAPSSSSAGMPNIRREKRQEEEHGSTRVDASWSSPNLVDGNQLSSSWCLDDEIDNACDDDDEEETGNRTATPPSVNKRRSTMSTAALAALSQLSSPTAHDL